MPNVTDSALERLARAMGNLQADGPSGFRMVPGQESQFGLALDAPAEGDKVFAHQGATDIGRRARCGST